METKKHVLKRDWTTCLEYASYFRLNSQHNCVSVCVGGGGVDDHLMSMRIFALRMNKIFT